jgi:hypothetical protein
MSMLHGCWPAWLILGSTSVSLPSSAGGGAALLHLSELLPAFRETLPHEEEKLGCDIVMKALRRWVMCDIELTQQAGSRSLAPGSGTRRTGGRQLRATQHQ